MSTFQRSEEHQSLIETAVFGAAVDLFHSRGLAVAPSGSSHGKPELPLPEAVAEIQCTATEFSATLYFCCMHKLVDVAYRNRAKRPASDDDWVREMCNQLAGKVSRRYNQSGVAVQLGIPRSVAPETLLNRVNRATRLTNYEFRTPGGRMLLVVDGHLPGSKLQYINSNSQREAGDALFFGDGE